MTNGTREALIKSGAQDAGISYADVVRFFVRLPKSDAGLLAQVKEVFGNMTE